jgi:very-short-patch-repair endonuclease
MGGHDEGRLAAVARVQHGVFTRRQARDAGFTDKMIRHRVRSESWCRLHPDVFVHASVAATTRRDLLAATLAAGGVASHESAARLVGMHPVPRTRPVVTMGDSAHHHDLDGVRVHRYQDLDDRWTTTVDGIPTTTSPRTILDLGSVLSVGRLEAVLDHALDHRLVDLGSLIECFDSLAKPGRRGVVALRPLILARGGGLVADTSELERMFTRLLRRAGLPEPERQVLLGGRELIGRVDFLFRSHGLIVEVDGRLGHTQVLDFESDRRRDQRALVAGFRVVRFTYRQIAERPDEVIHVLGQLLAA